MIISLVIRVQLNMGLRQSRNFRAERKTIEMIIPEQVLIGLSAFLRSFMQQSDDRFVCV